MHRVSVVIVRVGGAVSKIVPTKFGVSTSERENFTIFQCRVVLSLLLLYCCAFFCENRSERQTSHFLPESPRYSAQEHPVASRDAISRPRRNDSKMMTVSENYWSSNQRSSLHKLNDRIVHQDNYSDVQQSSNNNTSLITKRGFKPSDMFDPQKKEFLTNLSYKLFPNDRAPSRSTSPYLHNFCEDLENKPIIVGEKEVDLNKIFTPAPDSEEHMIKKNRKFEKTFASSAFYVPGIHPTVKEQMDLARAISRSLSDSSNQMSKGQSMYVNRKKRSVKWVHEGKGRNTSNSCATPIPVANHDTPYRPPSSLRQYQTTNKYGTYPKPALKNSLPKMEPFPVVATKTTNIPVQTYVSGSPTKLNDIYASPKSPRLPLMSGKSFNTAPRGWGEVKDYYRPVTFDDNGNTYKVPYTSY